MIISIFRRITTLNAHASRTTTNIAWALVSQIGGRGSIVIASMLVSSMLGVKSFEAFSYLNLTASMFATFAIFGMGTAASRYFAKITDSSSSLQIRLVMTMLCIVAATCFLVAILLWFLPQGILQIVTPVTRWMLAIAVFFITTSGVFINCLYGTEDFQKVALLTMLSALIMVFGVIVAKAVTVPEIALWAFVASQTALTLGAARAMWKRLDLSSIDKFKLIDKSTFREVIYYCGPLFITSVFSSSGLWLAGNSLLHNSSQQSDFSVFAVGLQWFSLVLLIPGVAANVFQSKIIRSSVNQSKNGDNKSLRQSIIVCLGSSFVVAVGLVAASPVIINLYGSNLISSSQVLVVFISAAFIASPINTIGNVISSLRRHGEYIWLVVTMIWFFFLHLSIHFLCSYGVTGVAISLVIAYTVQLIIVLCIAKIMQVI